MTELAKDELHQRMARNDRDLQDGAFKGDLSPLETGIFVAVVVLTVVGVVLWRLM